MKSKINSHLSDIVRNFAQIRSNKERIQKMVNAGVSGISDPENGTHLSQLTDLSSMNALRWIKLKMEETEEGRRVLKNKPRVTEQSINFKNLINYKPNTLGFQYYQYMTENKFSPNERPVAKFIPDIELAYICQRYKETHDYIHVILGYNRSVPDEIAVKWFEALHLRLPSSSIASLFGTFRMSPGQILNFYSKYLNHIVSNSERSKFVLGFYYEERLNEDIDKLRQEMNIVPLNKF